MSQEKKKQTKNSSQKIITIIDANSNERKTINANETPISNVQELRKEIYTLFKLDKPSVCAHDDLLTAM